MEQKKSTATIVIPCYNGANYLGRCLDSVICQEGAGEGRVQVIVVDDGSTDASLEIAGRYAEHIPFVQVIRQENRGAAAARNAGIEAAEGQYLLFLDADDWLDRDAVALLLQAAEETGAQVVHYLLQHERLGQKRAVENGIQSKTLLDKKGIHTQAMPLMLGGTQLNSSCLNLYDLAFLREHGIRFEEGRRMGEDARFVWQVISQAGSMYFINRPLYHYFYNTSSAVHNVTAKHMEDALEFPKQLRENLGKWDLDTPQNRKLIRQGILIMALDLIPKAADKQLILEMLKDKSLWEAWGEDGYRPDSGLACLIAQNAYEDKIQKAYLAVKLYSWKRRWLNVWGKDLYLRLRHALRIHLQEVKSSLPTGKSKKTSE